MTANLDAFAVNLRDVVAAIDETNAELDAAHDRILDLESTVGIQALAIGNLNDQVTALQAALVLCREGDPDPEPAHRMLIGATVDRIGSESREAATLRFEKALGKPLDIVRRFTGTPVTTFDQTSNFVVDKGKRSRIISFKEMATGAGVETFLRSIPADGYTTYVMRWHEPENDGGTHTASWFKQQQAELLAAIRKVNRPDLIPAFCLMGWLDRDASATTSSADWFPAEASAWVMGIDPYDPWNKETLPALCKPTLDLWRKAGGTRWMITETATHRTGVDGAKWISDGYDWCRSEGAEAVCWFDSAVGVTGGATWHLTDPLMYEAMAAQIRG